MVKNQTLSLKDLMLSIFKFKTFQKSISSKLLIIYNLVLLLLIAVVSLFSNNIENYSASNNLSVFLFMLLGLPFLLMFFYGIFYIFLNAYEIKRKSFFESYFVFLSLFLPFIFIGNLLNSVGKFLLISEVSLVISFLLLLLVISFLIVFVQSFKNYYNISGFKITSSLLFMFGLNLSFIIIQYLTYLISIIK